MGPVNYRAVATNIRIHGNCCVQITVIFSALEILDLKKIPGVFLDNERHRNMHNIKDDEMIITCKPFLAHKICL